MCHKQASAEPVDDMICLLYVFLQLFLVNLICEASSSYDEKESTLLGGNFSYANERGNWQYFICELWWYCSVRDTAKLLITVVVWG